MIKIAWGKWIYQWLQSEYGIVFTSFVDNLKLNQTLKVWMVSALQISMNNCPQFLKDWILKKVFIQSPYLSPSLHMWFATMHTIFISYDQIPTAKHCNLLHSLLWYPVQVWGCHLWSRPHSLVFAWRLPTSCTCRPAIWNAAACWAGWTSKSLFGAPSSWSKPSALIWN